MISAPVLPTTMSTVTTMPPGLMVSVQVVHPWRVSPLVAACRWLPSGFRLTVTVWLWPADRVPDSGVTVTWPRPDPSAMDHETRLPVADAFRVNEPAAVGVTVTVVALTLSVTGGGGGGGVVVDGAGELGLGLVLVGLGELWVGLGEGLGELLAGVGCPPAVGVGAAGALAGVVGCAALCFGLPVPLGLPFDVVPRPVLLLPGPDVVVRNVAATSWCPGLPLARATPTQPRVLLLG
jgi:hypothetical protein